MASSFKTAQVQGTASTGTYTTLYNSTTQAVISTIVVCNTAASSATYRIGIADSAGTPAAANWLFYDTVVDSNDSIVFGLGLGIESGKYIRVSSSANTVSFTASIAEIS